jgi:hypothetical protein
MAYRFKHNDKSVQDGIRRVALKQIDTALAEIDNRRLGTGETVHQLCKRCKKLIDLIGRRQAVLEADAFALGTRLLAEPEKALLQRWHALWDIWQDERPPEEEALAA